MSAAGPSSFIQIAVCQQPLCIASAKKKKRSENQQTVLQFGALSQERRFNLTAQVTKKELASGYVATAICTETLGRVLALAFENRGSHLRPSLNRDRICLSFFFSNGKTAILISHIMPIKIPQKLKPSVVSTWLALSREAN